MQWFSSSRVLECHVKHCLAINHTKSVLLLEKNQYVNFQNFKRLATAPFVTNCDLESVLIPSTGNIDFGPNITKYQDHIVCRYGYKSICVDDWYSKPHKTFFGKDAIDKCLNDMIKESEYCSKIIESELNKPIVMATKDHDDFENSTKCWIFKKENEEGEVKVQVHDHIDGKYCTSRL